MIEPIWEARWAPYDEATYQAALAYLRPSDVVLDIGAGDLRFARRAAARSLQVIAVESNPALLTRASWHNRQLTVICGDALTTPVPSGVTVAVLLMRHCTHFPDYVARLRAAGCRRLITNARWGMGVESLSLSPQVAFDRAAPGWYACLCGQVGFKHCPPEWITTDMLQQVESLEQCPACGAGHDGQG